jgi:hypothetical protein
MTRLLGWHRGALLAVAVLIGTGCDIVRGPTPLNDAPVIRRLGEYTFVDDQDQIVQTTAYIDLLANEQHDWDLEVIEPEGEALTVTVGPLPRGWSYDDKRRVMRAAPDHRQRTLIFTVYIVAEDSHDPPAYDTRVLSFNVN